MQGLRADRERLLERHRARARPSLEALAEAAGGGDPRRTNEWSALLAQPPELLVSVAICAAEARSAHARTAREAEPGSVFWAGTTAVSPFLLVRAFRRRRLPWTAEDAELLLDLAAGADLDAAALAAGAAEKVLRSQPGEPRVYRALEALRRELDARRLHETAGGGVLQRIRALVAANAPAGVLDVTLLQEGDAWAEAAVAAAREHARSWDGTGGLLAHLASTRGSRPPARWVETTRRLLASAPEAGSLVRALLVPLVDGSGGRLAPANQRLVCGAAWAAGLTPGDAVPLLRDVALACMRASPVQRAAPSRGSFWPGHRRRRPRSAISSGRPRAR